MSAKKIQFSLEFNADTKKAEQQLKKLQDTLTKATSASTAGQDLGLVPKLEAARKSAMQLKIALNNATNIDTGKLNLNKFSRELSQAGLSVNKLAAHMKRLGPEGVEAFKQMTQAVADADNKIFSLQGGMKRLANTFFNTLRYQASAQAINMMTSSITNAISYTKELDKSLTDIMMVTEYNRDQMTEFAKAANKAAKSLATTTNEYAKASLIYFQQGYETSEAMKRAETTIRLSHAVRKSAQEVSEWMTAIWNNFDDGTRSLEHYANVLAELGARTASSADEIATGLSKFAAVADTVGLSYEYAASALATLTAETRQSADVVGTALKTLFSRMEQLQLGETLDDGTDLGKYSLALQSVGVDIKDVNGELKDMDQILDETAMKWSVLSKDQQVALAQSVAGVRQYTQFIALMDNYDIMQNNIKWSKDAAGSLEKMQQAYKESIQGIQDEQKAASEALSAALMDEDDIKDFYKATTKMIEFVTDLVDAFGGLEGVLLLVASVLTKLYQPKIATFMSNLGYTIKDTGARIGNFALNTVGKSSKFQTQAEKMRMQMIHKAGEMEANEDAPEGAVEITEKITAAKIDLQNRSNQLTASEKQLYEWQIESLEAIKKATIEESNHLKVLEAEREAQEDKVYTAYDAKEINEQAAQAAQAEADAIKQAIARRAELKKQLSADTTLAKKTGTFIPKIDGAIAKAEEHRAAYTETKDGKRVIARGDMAAKRQEIGNDMAVILDELEGKAEGLELDFSGARSSLSRFVKHGGEEIDVFIARLKDLQEAVNTQRGKAQERISLGKEEMAQLETTASKTLPADPQQVTEIDTGYLEQRSRKVGAMQGNMSRALNKMRGITQGTPEDQRQAIGAQASEALAAAKAQADELGLNLKDLGFNDATADLDKFVNEGIGDLDSLIAKLKEVRNAVEWAGANELQNTSLNAVAGTQNSAIAGFNTLEKTGANAGETINILDKGLTQLDEGTSSNKKASKTSQVSKENKASITALKNKAAELKKQLALQKQVLAQTKKGSKEEAKAAEAVKKTEREIKEFNEQVKAQIKLMQKDRDAIVEATQGTNGYQDAQDRAGQEVQELANATAEAEKKNIAIQGTMGDLSEEAGKLGQDLDKIKFTDMFAGFMSSAMSVASGFMMVENGVASLTEAINSGEAELSDYVAAFSAIGPGLMQLGGPFLKAIGWILAKAAARKTAAKIDKQATEEEIQSDKKEQASSVKTGLFKIAEHMTKGPAGWIMAAVGVAALAAIGIAAAVGSVKSGVDKGNEKAEEEKLEKNREINSAASEVSKTLTGIEGHIDTFKQLRESGESTVEVIEDLKGSLKDTDFQLKELMSKAKGSASWDFLKDAQMDLLELQTLLNKEVLTDADIEKISSQTAAIKQQINQTAAIQSLNTWRTSRSDDDANAMFSAVGTAIEGSENLLQQAEQEFLSQSYKNVDEAMEAWAKIAFETIVGKDLAQKSGINFKDIAPQMLNYAPPKVSRVINGLNLFSAGGAIHNRYGSERAAQAQQWAGRNQSKLAYANDIDFSTGNENDWDQQYLNLLDQTQEAKIVQGANKLGYDERTFETYVDILVDVNTQLDENDKTSKQLALNNLKLNKGLHTLSKNWADISETLREGKRGSIEYAEALGSLGSALEEAFGYAPTAEFIEAHLGTIEEVANGDIEALQRLQDAIAVDMVYNMEYKTAINGQSKSPKEIQDILLGLLSKLDTSLELGENATVSQDYLDSLQAMLNSGQMTSDELDALMRAKGFEIEYDGWKEIPGPSTRVRQDYYHAGEKDPYKTDYIETKETLTVPIINGKAPEAGTQTSGNASSKAKIVRGPDGKNIDSSIFEKSDEAKKKIEEEKDRYYYLDKTLDSLNSKYNSVAKAKERAFGQDHLDLLADEIALTNELADVTNNKLVAAEDHLVQDRKALEQFGATFDENGVLANYDELMDAQAAYAKKSGNDEQYQKFKDALSQYETTLQLTQDLKQEIVDYTNQALDLKLEAINYQVTARVEIADTELDWIEYQLEHLVDPATDAVEAIELIAQKMEIAKDKADEYRRGLELVFDDVLSDEQLEALKSGDFSVLDGLDLDSAQIEALQKYRDGLKNETEALYSARIEFFDTITTGMESWNEQFDALNNKMAFFSTVIDTYKNVVDLVGRKNLGLSAEYMAKLSQQQVDNSIEAARIAKEQLEFNKQALKSLKDQRDEAMRNAATEEERVKIEKEWKDTIDNAEQQVQELEETVQSSWVDSLTTAAEAFRTSVDLAAEAFEDAMTGIYGSFERLQMAFDRAATANERYLDDYTKIYELTKLNRNITKSMDNTDSVKAKTALRELQEEINKLQENETEMSQYDLEYLQKKYDLKLAEIALEEAQNAKSQVRMQRDAEGNWGYVYTANEAAQEAAEQQYEDKLYASQEHTQNRINELQNLIIENERQMMEELSTLSPEQENYEAEKLRISEHYAAQRLYLKEQLDRALLNSSSIYQNDWQNYSNMTGYKISADQDWTDNWKETILAQTTGFDTLEEYYLASITATSEFTSSLSGSYNNWKTNVSKAFEAVGKNITTFGTDAPKELDKVTQAVDKIKKSLVDPDTGLAAKAELGFQALINKAHEKYELYAKEISPYVKKNEEIIRSLDAIISKQGQVADIKEGYYGLVTVGETTYRTEDKYDTKEEAQQAAAKMASSYVASALAYNKASGPNKYSAEYLKAITDSVSTTDGLSGLNYQNNLKNVPTYTAPNAGTEGALVDKDIQYESGSTVAPTTKYAQNTYPKLPAGTFMVLDDDRQKTILSRFYTKDFGDGKGPVPMADWNDTLSKGSYTFHSVLFSGGKEYGVLEHYPGGGFVHGKSKNLATVGSYVKEGETTDLFKKEDILKRIKSGHYATFQAFDTGGYTGSWDSSGRLAMLHQKEIVLNAHDTENFLAAINIVRDIASAIDLRAAAQQSALSQITAASVPPMTQTLEQEVTIHAEFPNATQRTEIEAAFDTLLNRASQFANRKNK